MCCWCVCAEGSQGVVAVTVAAQRLAAVELGPKEWMGRTRSAQIRNALVAAGLAHGGGARSRRRKLAYGRIGRAGLPLRCSPAQGRGGMAPRYVLAVSVARGTRGDIIAGGRAWRTAAHYGHGFGKDWAEFSVTGTTQTAQLKIYHELHHRPPPAQSPAGWPVHGWLACLFVCWVVGGAGSSSCRRVMNQEPSASSNHRTLGKPLLAA
ncbi:hypothetical protein BP6252_01348 [Coleophoma cylindrospora]|uniref:Uncharacterized protein n=1 Tax=Coleophoma cylindrospora TaxID=1849047 RepID=A0A3D8SSN5_9HELO|nr:hypothetical protein BP6252_01348 [Coleophoma cylindrospora]